MKYTLSCALTALALSAAASQPLKVACVGNSITFGLTTDNPTTDSYPAQLAGMLPADRYEVRNFGRSGATLLEKGHNPYVSQPEYKAALDYAPDIAVIHLGINDTDPRNWPNYSDEFAGDYVRLIESFRRANPNVRVILANLTPIGAEHRRFKSGTRQWRDAVRQSVAAIADATGCELIDFETPLLDRRDLMPDAVHPNREGLGLLARTVYSAVTGDYGGLHMSPLYADGMVLQRNKRLTIRGTADAGAKVTVSFAGHSATATASNTGQWSVKLPPMDASTAGQPLTVTDGKSSLTFNNVAVGEVWVASGQSNMLFTVGEELRADSILSLPVDPSLRIFNMQPRYITNKVEWSAAELDSVNRLKYYKFPTSWAAATPAAVRPASAIAYMFARELRDNMPDVPVGIIQNPVGGAPAESFIDIDILNHGMPDALIDWRHNDYVQPWVQQRAGENAPAKNNPRQRHPYEPSYLYSAGVRPIEGYNVAGVLWYQGESNAHNPDLHSELFPMVVESWRRAFNDTLLPVYTVQLSSINRPSWPLFRDSQRRLAERMPRVEMAVSYDFGDSLDVHPRNKIPVAHRLATIALAKKYGRPGTDFSGPKPLLATRVDSIAHVKMAHADGMTTTDGDRPHNFELAEYDGVYHPATASINGNLITLHSDAVATPRFVRYGWRHYVGNANLINNSNIPSSTFKMEINPAPILHASVVSSAEWKSTNAEKGMEHGISAPFGGAINNGRTYIVAGGCNFPHKDPLAPSATKKTYSGIYEFNAGSDTWTRIGSLPKPTAYGATLQHGNTLYFAGGVAEGMPVASNIAMDIDSKGKAELRTMAPMPARIDNAGFCSGPQYGYVVGGNRDGKPSNRVYAYDFAANSWIELPPMPGNPRTQPTAAFAKGRLYVWGGFAGKGDGREATLETGGLMFNPANGQWSEIAAPTDSNGEQVSLGGGTAVTLPYGRVAATGGVNKDVFLEALRNQAPDYLQHSPEWYRFNGRVMIFDPETGVWISATYSPECARAGALLLMDSHNNLDLFGGELKPRIRTPRMTHIIIDE